MSTSTITSKASATSHPHIPDSYPLQLPEVFMPFEAFAKEFTLGSTSTEKLHPVTKALSQTTHQNILKGMELLLKVDEGVIEGLELFIPSIKKLTLKLVERLQKGGRIFLVGSGSSGRVGVDIAAKCIAKFPEAKERIHGIIAGGDSALIRAKEGFEDSEKDGEKALQDFHIGANDTIFLVSASGSASFNVGCGHFCANLGASVFYFYNSKEIPVRTKQLFERNLHPVTPLCLDIGPQAIGGSTRLQGATLAEACLGSLLVSTLYLNKKEALAAETYPMELLSGMRKGIELIRANLQFIQHFVKIECSVFSDPRANFRQLKDSSEQGYVTFVAQEDSMREVLIDSTETSPTFSTSPIRRETEANKKRAEFRAYLMGKESNEEAWKALLGRDVSLSDKKDIENFLLSGEAEGVNSYVKRPLGKGNFLIGVAKLKESEPLPSNILQALSNAKKQGGSTGLLILSGGRLKEELVKQLSDEHDALVVLENTPADTAGFTETIILKQVLNLISNSTMILMNKVHGNQMIDVRASNNKLIDRCMRLVKEIWRESHPNEVLEDQVLYQYVVHSSSLKKKQEEKGIYTPSVVKIVLAMLALKKTPAHFQEVVEFLSKMEERVDWIGEQG